MRMATFVMILSCCAQPSLYKNVNDRFADYNDVNDDANDENDVADDRDDENLR